MNLLQKGTKTTGGKGKAGGKEQTELEFLVRPELNTNTYAHSHTNGCGVRTSVQFIYSVFEYQKWSSRQIKANECLLSEHLLKMPFLNRKMQATISR